jgi:hypothetical protein
MCWNILIFVYINSEQLPFYVKMKKEASSIFSKTRRHKAYAVHRPYESAECFLYFGVVLYI